MLKIISYKVIHDTEADRLANHVTSLLTTGWQLYGTLLMTGWEDDGYNSGLYYAQAMVLYEAGPSNAGCDMEGYAE